MNQITTQTMPAFGMDDMAQIARALVTSKLFGVQTDAQALALCLIAQAEGRHPASAASDYHIINGRPSKKADSMLRDFLLNGGKVEWHSLTDECADATFSHPAGGKARIAWDADRVKRAGIQNAMHSRYPRQMLRSRVVSEGVRTVFPAATSGMYVPEENEAMEPRNVTPDRRASAPRVEAAPAESTPFDDEPDEPTEAQRATVKAALDRFLTCESEPEVAGYLSAHKDAIKALPKPLYAEVSKGRREALERIAAEDRIPS